MQKIAWLFFLEVPYAVSNQHKKAENVCISGLCLSLWLFSLSRPIKTSEIKTHLLTLARVALQLL